MKHFIFHKFDKWKSPLEIFPLVKNKSPHLFFSGNSENIRNSGKFSFIPFAPEKIWKIPRSNATDKNRRIWKSIQEIFLEKKEFFKKNSHTISHWKFPFSGGLAGVFSYDFLRVFSQFSDIQENKKTDKHFPLAILGLYDKFFAFDHEKKEFFLAGQFYNHQDAYIFFKKWEKEIQNLKQSKYSKKEIEEDFSPEISYNQYKKNFENCQNEIKKGKSFQINFSQKFCAKIKKNPSEFFLNKTSGWGIFVEASKKNPAQMMYFYEEISPQNSFSLISCSPERLFSCDRNKNIFTQPIAGTRHRGASDKEEKDLEYDLTHSSKEKSEHSMIVDLLRNDFGKVSQFGSVKVLNFMRVEKYATVMHLVTDIIGKIHHQKNIFDVFESLFPGGTITGTPKKETIKILTREEISSRNFYCGSAGYFSFCGSADWNILIRTLEKYNENITGRAGGGLVWGANPYFEYKETLHKFSGIKKIFE